MRVTDSSGNLLCFAHKPSDWKEGLDFLTDDALAIQVGTWWYHEGRKLDIHTHNDYPRETRKTMEFVFVVEGRLLAKVFDSSLTLVSEFTIHAGEFAVFIDGGHGYETLDPDTKVIEVKNGPFVSVEHDKVKYAWR